MPSRDKGYPAIMNDFKGKRIGVAARGSSNEKYFNAMLKDAGLKPEDVTYVAVGAPSTTYTALVIGKQIDAAIMYQPITQICHFNKTCETVIDMTIGEGPKSLEATIGATIVFAARKEMVESNPKLMEAFKAAMTDAPPGSTIRRISTSSSRSTRRSSRSATWRAPTRYAGTGSRV
jgi:NitT/TauT family transport system substrate-binding protein